MTGRSVKVVSDMELDEVSLVDRPANPHAAILIAKSFQGANMPNVESPTGYWFEDGTPVPADVELGPDDLIFDADGEAYGLDDETIAELEEHANSGELEEVGKSAFGRQTVTKSLAEQLAEQLDSMISKGADDGTRALLSKAVEAISASEQRADQLEEIAKSERDIRLTREYISKAESYGEIPGVTAGELGPILKRAEESLPAADCAVLNKVFTSIGKSADLFREIGRAGNGTNGADPFGVIEGLLEGDTEVAKGATGATKPERVTKAFEANPEAYDEYMATRYGR